jgi:hypothetical protein
MAKKGAIGLTVAMAMLLVFFGWTGCYNGNIAEPFTQEQMLAYLEDKYDEEFVFVQKEFDSENGKFSKYVYSFTPKENPDLSFYLADVTIQAQQISRWDRVLKDTYPLALLSADFQTITDLCDLLTIQPPSFDDFGSNVYYEYNRSTVILNMPTDYDLADIDKIANELTKVVAHLKSKWDHFRFAQNVVHIKSNLDNGIVEGITENETVLYISFDNGYSVMLMDGKTDDLTHHAIAEFLTEAKNQ